MDVVILASTLRCKLQVLPGLKIGGAYSKAYFNQQFMQGLFSGRHTDDCT